MEMVGTSLRCFFLNALGFTVQLGASIKCKGENKSKAGNAGLKHGGSLGSSWFLGKILQAPT